VQGGLITAWQDGKEIRTAPLANHLLMDVVLFFPDDGLILPQPTADPGRLAYLVTSLLWGRWDRIGAAMRATSLPPQITAVLAAAEQAGAYGVFPSGCGPALVALVPYKAGIDVAAAMEARSHEAGWPGNTRVTRVREPGLRLQEINDPVA
jgi:hypothetical protein